MSHPAEIAPFSALKLAAPLLQALQDVGYETPSPIQAATIPLLLQGRDVLGQAQTGTGKTAAFALPALNNLDPGQKTPQVLVLAPTRELAIQVAEAFQTYAKHLPGFHVLPIYGGQSYGPQLTALRRGVHVVVGTPGRIIDHLEKGSLQLDQLRTLVLDEADEMLRMGFIDDVERILQRTPAQRQTALFSATMPPEIKRIAKTYMRDPAEITVAAKTTTSDNIRQRFWLVSGLHKLDALTRILESEPFDGMIIFARTKMATEELAQKLQARGFSAAAINGDLPQQQRERTVSQLKDGQVDILVATDVAARGLDVDRISHVINYDVPYDPESYVHRIGRTGRAGRKGEAILFITPRERGLLRAIERSTRQTVTQLEIPSVQTVNNVRIARFKKQVLDTIEAGDLELFSGIVEDLERENDVPARDIAAALAKLSRRGVPLLLDKPERETSSRPERSERAERAPRSASAGERPRFSERSERPYERAARPERSERPAYAERSERPAHKPFREPVSSAPEGLSDWLDVAPSDQDMPVRERPARRQFVDDEGGALEVSGALVPFRVDVGQIHGVTPKNLVGAIANEIGMDSRHIGRIDIQEVHSTVELPNDLPKSALKHLQTVMVAGRPLLIRPGAGTPVDKTRNRPPGAAVPPWMDATPPAPAPRRAPAPRPRDADNRYGSGPARSGESRFSPGSKAPRSGSFGPGAGSRRPSAGEVRGAAAPRKRTTFKKA